MNTQIKVCLVAGARPNFMKIGPVFSALDEVSGFDPFLIHTGQHYDDDLSRVFFDELRLPRPESHLQVGSGSHAAQTAVIMTKFEEIMQQRQPQVVLVVGDVTSTIACALVACKFRLDEAFYYQGELRDRPVVVHVEAGLRSFDREMPEEINRILTDSISDLLYVTEPSGVEHLTREGVAEDRIRLVGNVMIDTLLSARDRAMQSDVLERLGISERQYCVLTLHRPSNVDDPADLGAMLQQLDALADQRKFVFPVHPRTRAKIDHAGVELRPDRWLMTPPIGYLDFIRLVAGSACVLTESGGIQEDTTVLGFPCVTLRENTERPVTVSMGTNTLAGTDPEQISAAFDQALNGRSEAGVPDLWDGSAAVRIAADMARRLLDGGDQ